MTRRYVRKQEPEQLNRNCPLCGDLLLHSGLEHKGFYRQDVNYCQRTVKIPGKYPKNHYVEDLFLKEVTQFALPYRVITTTFEDKENTTKISILRQYSTGAHYFKTILKCGAWTFCEEEKLIKRIKTLMVFS